MEEVVQQLSGNPLLLVLVGLLVFIVAFFILRSLLRIVLFLAALVILYFGYVNFLQEKYPLPQVDPGMVSEWTEKISEYIPEDFGAKLLDSNYTRPQDKDNP
jgi:hypothetical protein